MLTTTQMKEILAEVEYRDWVLHVEEDAPIPYLQVRFVAPDVDDWEPSWQHGRKWWLSSYMTKSELVQTALKAVLTAEEHEARERFLYQGRRIFGPHINVDVLWEASEHHDVR